MKHSSSLPLNRTRLPLRSLILIGIAATLFAATAHAQGEVPAPAPKPAAQPTLPKTKAFKRVADEMDKAAQARNEVERLGPLAPPKGNGLRVLMTGHSWVGPGRITFPQIAKAAGYPDTVLRAHISGGGTGSANSIWLNEHGKDTERPTRVILLPAIPTGQWDVMTWGMFTNDQPQDYIQWMEPCLKANPAMVFYIQDGWPTPKRDAGNSTPETLSATLIESYQKTMIPMFTGNLAALNAAYPGKVHMIPAGAAVVEMIGHYVAGEVPALDCLAEIKGGKKGIYSPDSFHLSRVSGIGWLVGYCYYGVLYKKSPELIKDFSPPNVDPTLDRFMRQSAWHAITHSPYTGLTDANGNGIADQIE